MDMEKGFSEQWAEKFLKRLAVPRPNHSRYVSEAAGLIKQQLKDWGYNCDSQFFRLRPFKHLLVGFTGLVFAVGYLLLMVSGFTLFAVIPAILIPLNLVLEFEFFISLTSRIYGRTGENISLTFRSPNAEKELIINAHYDSKTDLFDHVKRQRIYDLFIPMIVFGILSPIIFFLLHQFSRFHSDLLSNAVVLLAFIYVVFWLLVALAFGGYVFIPRNRQSPGVVDNATAVTVLLSVVRAIDPVELQKGNCNITFLFTGGEEVSMQGSHAYVKQRFRKQANQNQFPCYLLNLEMMAQSGDLMVWKKYGVFLKYLDCDPLLLDLLNKIVPEKTGKPLLIRGNSSDDAFCFLSAGVPAITMARSGNPLFEESGFHSLQDSMERFSMVNFKSDVSVLYSVIEDFCGTS